MYKKNYTLQIKEIDEKIHQELQKALEINSEISKTDILSDKQIKKIYQIIENKKKLIFSLFNESFSENEQKVKEHSQMAKPLTKENDVYTKIADRILKKRVNQVLDKIIYAKQSTIIEVIVGIDRKVFINQILDEDIEFDLGNDQKEISER
jgi:hypothetical protein